MPKINPYEVEGKIDYNKIVEEFGATLIDDNLLRKIKHLHPLLRRHYFFAHRDFDKVLHYHSQGNKFALVSGRGPSANMHLAHLLLYNFNKYIQDEFGAFVFVPFSDDEKFMFKQELDFETVQKFAYENALDMAAIGFDPKKTEFLFDLKHMNQDLYNLSVKCAKRITLSTVKSAFGFSEQNNIGSTFYPAMQAAHILYPTVKYGLPSLVTVGIDQDVFIKVTRDVAGAFKLPKPAALLSRFMKDLGGGTKMSASKAETTIYTTDSDAEIKAKIMRAFTGGRETVAEQRKLGANPDVCSVYEYLTLFFLNNDFEVENLRQECKTGKILCGECKERLVCHIQKFLTDHKKKREKAKQTLHLYTKTD